MASEVTIITDGSCWPNPGPGGWACILRQGEWFQELSGGLPDTTNNRMELTAAIEGLRALTRPCRVTVITDSQYVQKGMTEHRLGRARRVKLGEAVPNRDLWIELERAAALHEVTWRWVRGHDGHEDNERCDVLAGEARKKVALADFTLTAD
jgi:ribonuclease HI